LGRVWIVAKDSNLLTIFAAPEEDFGGILRGIYATEECIIL
jgi:hypothetical protein